MALQENAEPFFPRRGGGYKELANVNSLNLAVHLIEPEQIAFAGLFVRPRLDIWQRKIRAVRQTALACQRLIDGIHVPELAPRVARNGSGVRVSVPVFANCDHIYP